MGSGAAVLAGTPTGEPVRSPYHTRDRRVLPAEPHAHTGGTAWRPRERVYVIFDMNVLLESESGPYDLLSRTRVLPVVGGSQVVTVLDHRLEIHHEVSPASNGSLV